MAKWIRVDSNRRMNPKMRKAGAWGCIIIETIWEIAKEFDLDGILSDEYFNADYIGEWLRLDKEIEWKTSYMKHVETAMEQLIKVGLIKRKENTFLIHDWERYQFKNSTERVRKYREGKKKEKNQEECNVTCNDVTPNNNNNNNETITEQNNNTQKLHEGALRATDYLRASILKWKPNHRIADDGNYGSLRKPWAKHIEKLHRIDGISWKRMKAVLDWLPTDDFWCPNIQSGEKFRKQWDQLEAKMEGETKKHQDNIGKLKWADESEENKPAF